jgi:hypothetical protein
MTHAFFFSGNAGCCYAMQVGQHAVLPEILITVISRLVKTSPQQFKNILKVMQRHVNQVL